MKDFPERKHTRLKGYDYNQNGGYFITFCVKGRQELLGKIVGRGILDAPRMELSEYGVNLRNAFDFMNRNNATITADKYIIMPNHVHIIVIVIGDGASGKPRPTNAVISNGASGKPRPTNTVISYGASGKPRPTNAVIPQFISSIKRYTNKMAGYNMWQSTYHDHIIRNEAEYKRIWQYIDNNPATWDDDVYHV